MKIKDIHTALKIFEEAAAKHAEATEQGNYKTGNKHYDKIIKAGTFLNEEGALNNLQSYLSNSNVGIRLWAASYFLTVNEAEAIGALDNIVQYSGIHSLIAETTLIEWRKGNLKLLL